MAKKTPSSTKPAAPAKVVEKPAAKDTPTTKVAKPAVKAAAKPAAKAAALAAPAAKAAKPKKAAAPKAPKAAKTSAAPAYTSDDVALRAYFISENRRNHGIHGDEHQDWIEAERQLAAETKKSKKSKS